MSIRRGNIEQRGENTWRIRYDLPLGPDGKRRQARVTFHGTRREAERELTRLLREKDLGLSLEPSRLTLGQLLEKWLEYAKPNLAAQTWERYALIIEKHLVPALGVVLLTRLSPLQIQAYYAEAAKTTRPGWKKPIATRTILHHHRLLRQVLQQAVKWRLLSVNPADAVDAPRPPRREMQILTPEQAVILLAKARGYTLFVPIALSLYAGLRKGEVFGLQWHDVNLDDAVLHIRRTIIYPAGGPAFKEPKTARGRRTIAMPSALVEIMREHRKTQQAHIERMGESYHRDLNLVCAQADGRAVANNIKRNFDNILSRAGLPQIRFHDLRHTHASAHLLGGVSPKVVSEILGHSAIGITLETYSHVLPQLQRDAQSRLDTLFGPKDAAEDAPS